MSYYTMPDVQKKWFSDQVIITLKALNQRNPKLSLTTEDLINNRLLPQFIKEFGMPHIDKYPNSLKSSMLGILNTMNKIEKVTAIPMYHDSDSINDYIDDKNHIKSIATNSVWRLKTT